MAFALIFILTFTLGIKIAVWIGFRKLRDKHPENNARYNSFINLAVMFIIPTAVLLVAVLVFVFWRGYV